MSDATRRLAMADFDYDLPQELISQRPLAERDASRLMVVNRHVRSISHRAFRDLPELLDPDDLLVVNDSRVIPARLSARKTTGGRAELLLLQSLGDGRWEALARPIRRLREGTSLSIETRDGQNQRAGSATIEERLGEGRVIVRLGLEVDKNLEHFGTAPLPPYVDQALADEERYQTIFGRAPGSAAAPTAALHFSDEITSRLDRRGIEITRVTLHIGLATFRPVTTRFADEHQIHKEWCSVDADAAMAIAQARRDGRRIVAVGTTAARTLETFGQRIEGGCLGQFSAMTDIYITPGYRWRMVDAMITNFHLPRSTLLLMISAFAGRDLVFEAYDEAIREQYRFFSFGDATLIV